MSFLLDELDVPEGVGLNHGVALMDEEKDEYIEDEDENQDLIPKHELKGIYEQHLMQIKQEVLEFKTKHCNNITLKHLVRNKKLRTLWNNKIKYFGFNESLVINGLHAIKMNDAIDFEYILNKMEILHRDHQREILQHIICYSKKERAPTHSSFYSEMSDISQYILFNRINWDNSLNSFSVILYNYLDWLCNNGYIFVQNDGNTLFLFDKQGWVEIDRGKATDRATFHVYITHVVTNFCLSLLQYYTYGDTMAYKSFCKQVLQKHGLIPGAKKYILGSCLKADISDFNNNKTLCIDKSRQVLSLLLEDKHGNAVIINHSKELKFSKIIHTDYNINVPTSDAVNIGLEAISSKRPAVKEFYCKFLCTTFTAKKVKFMLFLYSAHNNSGKSSMQFLNHRTLGQDVSKLLKHELIKDIGQKGRQNHSDSLSYVLDRFALYATDVDFSDGSRMLSSFCQSFIGDDAKTARAVYAGTGEKNNKATSVNSTNTWPIPCTSIEAAMNTKILVIQTIAQFGENEESILPECIFFKKTGTNVYKWNKEDKEYWFKLMVKYAIKILNDDSWLQRQNIPEPILEYSFENALTKDIISNNIKSQEIKLLPEIKTYINNSYILKHEIHNDLLVETIHANQLWNRYIKTLYNTPQYIKDMLRQQYHIAFMEYCKLNVKNVHGRQYYAKKQILVESSNIQENNNLPNYKGLRTVCNIHNVCYHQHFGTYCECLGTKNCFICLKRHKWFNCPFIKTKCNIKK